MGNRERATGSKEQRGGHGGEVTAPGQRRAPHTKAPTLEPAAPLWPFCRRSQEIREDLLEIKPCLFNAHARARTHTLTHTLPLSKSVLHSGVGYFQFLRKMYSNSTPCDWKVYSETCLQSPPASPASQPPCWPAPPCSLRRRRRRGDRSAIANPEGQGGEEKGLKSEGGAERTGWRRVAVARETPSCRWTCVSVCL